MKRLLNKVLEVLRIRESERRIVLRRLKKITAKS